MARADLNPAVTNQITQALLSVPTNSPMFNLLEDGAIGFRIASEKDFKPIEDATKLAEGFTDGLPGN